MIFTISQSLDCYFNLALEEHFLRDRDDDVFMLWQNDRTIVVGKNQNVFAEIDSDFVKKNDIRVVRRMTGGGAVYHDMGNINFTYITDAAGVWEQNFSRFAAPVISALRALGVPAEMSGRNDIVAGGRKISGNAQTVVDGRLLHHGTLLFNADMEVLQRALKPDPLKIQSRGIKSVASRVANISELIGRNISAQELIERIGNEVKKLPNVFSYALDEKDLAAAESLAEKKYRTWEWNIGYSPKYTFTKKKRMDCGIVEVFLLVENGVIRGARFLGDFFGVSDMSVLESAIAGVRHEPEDIKRALTGVDLDAFFGKMTLSELLEMLI